MIRLIIRIVLTALTLRFVLPHVGIQFTGSFMMAIPFAAFVALVAAFLEGAAFKVLRLLFFGLQSGYTIVTSAIIWLVTALQLKAMCWCFPSLFHNEHWLWTLVGALFFVLIRLFTDPTVRPVKKDPRIG